MALKTLYNRDTGQVFREKINENFDIMDKRETAHYTDLNAKVTNVTPSVGDIITSVTFPGGNYVPCDGRIILKSAYPELFEKIYGSFGLVEGSVSNSTTLPNDFRDSAYGNVGICRINNIIYSVNLQQDASTSDKYYQMTVSKYSIDDNTGILTPINMYAKSSSYFAGNNLVADSDGTMYYNAEQYYSSTWHQTIVRISMTDDGFTCDSFHAYSKGSSIGMVKTPLGILTWDSTTKYFQTLSNGTLSAISGTFELNPSESVCCNSDITIGGKAYFIMCGRLCSYNGTSINVINSDKSYKSCLSFDQGLLCIKGDGSIVFMPNFSGSEILIGSASASEYMYRVSSNTSKIEAFISGLSTVYKTMYDFASGVGAIAQVKTLSNALTLSDDPDTFVFLSLRSNSYSSSATTTTYSETMNYILKTNTPIPNITPGEGCYTNYICTKE